MKKTLLIALIVFVAILFAADVMLCLVGSLEMYPTAEQIEKGRIVYGLFLLPLAIFEGFLIMKVFCKQ